MIVFRRVFNWYLTVFKQSVGLPSYSGIQPKAQIGTAFHTCVLRSLRRLRRTRTVCFFRIWRNKSYSLVIRLYQLNVLLSSTLDLFVTLLVFCIFFIGSFNLLARWLHLPIIMTLFVLAREDITIIPIVFFYFLNGYAVMYWLSCLYIPLYKEWLYYNLSYVSVSQLAGDLPGKWGWKSLAMLYGYVIVRQFETYIRDWRVFQTARKLMKESGLDFSAMDIIDTYNTLHEVTPTYLILGEDFLLHCVMSCVDFIQVLISLF